MKIKFFIVVMLITAVISIVGGWDRINITDYTITTLVGIDKIDDEIKILLEYEPGHKEIPGSSTDNSDNISKSSNGEDSSSKNSNNYANINSDDILVSSGNSLIEALYSYQRRSSDDMYLGAVRSVIFSDNYAKSGIEEYINRIKGEIEYRKTVFVFTTNTKIQNMFDKQTLKTQNIGFDIEHMYKKLINSKLAIKSTVSQVLEDITIKDAGFLIGNFDVIDNKVEKNGYTIFKNAKKIGILSENESKGVNLLLINNCFSRYMIQHKSTDIFISSYTDKFKIKTDYTNGVVTFDINLNLDSDINYMSQMINLDDNDIKEIQKKISDNIEQDIIAAIQTSQTKYSCDYLNFYKYFRAKYGSVFKQINWEEKYISAKFNVNVNSKIVSTKLINYE
ncbi:MAG: hypothetical protein N2749_02975 [Clostridia bacterium]|nr:hypothetical protein [Clostridia bacterium]